MKLSAALLTCVLAAVIAIPAAAGVVVEETTNISGGMGGPHTEKRTLFIQGNKQKMVMTDRAVIIDLDRGTMTMLNNAQKTYTEMPFPPKGRAAAMMQNMGMSMEFKKTGQSQQIAGFDCDMFTSSGSMQVGDFSTLICFSPQAPGASEYTAFDKAMAAKMRDAGMMKMTSPPDGVPLSIESTTKLKPFSMPNMTPAQVDMMKKMMANRPPIVSKTTASTVKSQHLGADTFAVPAGYTKAEPPPARPGMMGGPPAAAPPESTPAPANPPSE